MYVQRTLQANKINKQGSLQTWNRTNMFLRTWAYQSCYSSLVRG